MPGGTINRRDFLKVGALSAAMTMNGRGAAFANPHPEGMDRSDLPVAKADACILVWLPGGVSQNETWDPKPFTPYFAGMKASEFRSTCRNYPTIVDGLNFGEGLESVGAVMDRGCVVRSISEPDDGSPRHDRYIYQAHTGYPFPSGFPAPSLGAIVARTLGARADNVPAYVDIGRNLESSATIDLFLKEVMGAGFYPQEFGPFEIGDPMEGARLLDRLPGTTQEDIERRVAYRAKLASAGPLKIEESRDHARYVSIVRQAAALMESPVKAAFSFDDEASRAALARYGFADRGDVIERFESGCLLARRLIESGVRFVEVEFPYAPFGHFDVHSEGASRMAALKARIDTPIAQLIRELDERGLLERTLVVVMSEFGRTFASAPGLGGEFARGDASSVESPEARGESVVFSNERMYGYHGHLRTSSALFFGGGVRGGAVVGKTADTHPMIAAENPVTLSDVQATIFHQLGIASDVYYVHEGRPVYVTNNGEGRAIRAVTG